MDYLAIKWIHIVSSTLLFGTGLGSAFYMFFASLTRDPRVIAVVVKYVVVADWLFTAPAIILQPATGFLMVHKAGFAVGSAWLVWSILLYLLAGAAWLPVVWMQIQMRGMAEEAARIESALPERYWKFLNRWIALGIVAFVALVVVFFLMVAKPA
ncbi:MAG: hypothetical protein JWN85_617 [Gammaproteobacteria bacterium]|nr:hypothetical protein [Gammaproteobacteria bacterium]